MAKGNQLKQRVTRAIIAHAFFRLESALTIALTILLLYFFPAPFPWWQRWYWVVLGLAGEVLVIYTSIADETTARQVVADMLRQEFNPREIRAPQLRQRVEKALDYRQRIEMHVRQCDAGVLREHLIDTTAGVAEWVANVFGLAKRLDSYQGDEVLARDLSEVPHEIANLRLRLQRETDESVRQTLSTAIAGKDEQLANLHKLQNAMEKAEYQLETTLTALGTVYSQIQLVNVKDIDSGRAQRLRQDINDQVAALQSLQESLDEVYGSNR